MKNGFKQRLVKLVCSKSEKGVTALKKLNGAHVKLGIVAVAFFLLAYAVETKAVLVLESSQDLFEVIH
jgi:hypothetical protein